MFVLHHAIESMGRGMRKSKAVIANSFEEEEREKD